MGQLVVASCLSYVVSGSGLEQHGNGNDKMQHNMTRTKMRKASVFEEIKRFYGQMFNCKGWIGS